MLGQTVFFDRLISGESDVKLCYMLQSWNMFRFMETENLMETESLSLIMAIQVIATMRNLLGVSLTF
jgi:hypothetical protein